MILQKEVMVKPTLPWDLALPWDALGSCLTLGCPGILHYPGIPWGLAFKEYRYLGGSLSGVTAARHLLSLLEDLRRCPLPALISLLVALLGLATYMVCI